jgi:hypothetical protein
MFVELLDCGWIATADVAEQILCLVLKLIEVGTNRQTTGGKAGTLGIFGAVGLTWIRRGIGLGPI